MDKLPDMSRFLAVPVAETERPKDNIETFLLEDKSRLVSLCRELKNSSNFKTLSLINAIERESYVELIYQLMRLDDKLCEFLNLKVNLPRGENISSLTGVWNSADWFEREMYDMHGILFDNHPNLKRILNPEDWEGFPLRKDYVFPVDALNEKIK